MLILYLNRKRSESDDIIDLIENLAIAFTVVYSNEGLEASDSILRDLDPPALVDDDRVVHGKEEILYYIDTLKDFLEEWQKFQTDACYCDAQGNVE